MHLVYQIDLLNQSLVQYLETTKRQSILITHKADIFGKYADKIIKLDKIDGVARANEVTYQEIIENYKKEKLNVGNDSLHIKYININFLPNYTRSYVLGKLGFNANSKIVYDDLRIGTDNLSATQNFKSITYTIDKNNNHDDLNINLVESSQTTLLKFGLHFDGLFKSAFLINLTEKKVLSKNDVAFVDVGVGDNFRYNFEYYIDNGFHWSFGIKSKFTGFTRNVPTNFLSNYTIQSGINALNIEYLDFTNQAYVQTVSFQKFLFGIGIENKSLKISSETISNTNTVIHNNS